MQLGVDKSGFYGQVVSNFSQKNQIMFYFQTKYKSHIMAMLFVQSKVHMRATPCATPDLVV